jgi:hypothetical protein
LLVAYFLYLRSTLRRKELRGEKSWETGALRRKRLRGEQDAEKGELWGDKYKSQKLREERSPGSGGL